MAIRIYRYTMHDRAHAISDSKTMKEYMEYTNPRLKFDIVEICLSF